QGFSKYSVHTNISHKLNKVITVGASMQFTESRQNRGLDNALAEVGRMGFPNQPVKKEDGSWNILTGAAIFNPVMEIESVTRYTDVTRFIGNWFAEFNIAKGFTYKLQIGYDLKNAHGYDFITSQDPHNVVKNAKGSGGQDWARSRTKLMDNIFTYTNKWDEHRFTATGVYSYMDYRSESTSAGITADGDDIIQVWNLGTYTDKNNYTIGSGFANNKLISFTGRINYVYADKYIVTATARYDGSSRFGKDSKWGMFPSVGLAWRASQENFLKNNPVITDLKLRGTWGVTGNQEIGNYMSLSHIESSASNSYTDGTNIVGGYIETVGNPNLQWERTTQVDFGIDLQLWNRLNINFDWYNRTTDNLLYNVPIPAETGFQKVLSNIGKVGNTGFEVTVGGDIYKNKDWSIDASVNFSTNTNEIKELYGDVERIEVKNGSTGIAQILEVGKPVNGVWTRQSLGIIQTQEQLDKYIAEQTAYYEGLGKAVPAFVTKTQLGDEVYADINGDGAINVNDYICNGSIEPKYFYGININARWKKLSLSIYGQGAWKYAAVIGDNDNSSGFSLASMQNMGNYVYDADNCIAGNNYIPTEEGLHNMWSATNTSGTSPRRGFAAFY
ncbi:MAG: TonB-dependent receptor, partial [Bacteroidaceae bacterium]|nr:TonB-dependent receptor [Bacteroidaceae bacterium]